MVYGVNNMSMLPMEHDIYGTPSTAPVLQDTRRQRRLADQLRNQSQEQQNGQMVGGIYVPTSITQHLARVLQGYQAGNIDRNATKQETDYNAEKQRKLAEILSGNKSQQIQDGVQETSTMPAYEPSQMDRFGSPMAERQPQVAQTPIMRQESPQEQMQRVQPQVLEYMAKFGNTPEAQYMLGQLNKQDDRAYAHGEKVDDRQYQDTREEKLYNRNRTDKLSDTDAERKYQDIVRSDMQGFQVSQQDRQFAQQYKLQAQSQGFQAGQNALSRAQQKELAGANSPPIAVLGANGKPVYVSRNDAIGQSPYSAKQEAADALKVQQGEQARIGSQQVLDQADLLFNHKGRLAGTGASSFISKLPATDAKDFQANLDTFKAQTFVPMVSALKGMGALSDAEGRKLSESVGALDPSMSEEAFANSLKSITKTLYDKAKANGLNVSLPDFANSNPASTHPEDIKGLLKKYGGK